jgi:hypothetical protein
MPRNTIPCRVHWNRLIRADGKIFLESCSTVQLKKFPKQSKWLKPMAEREGLWYAGWDGSQWGGPFGKERRKKTNTNP